jgi:hypothetical protein
MRQPRPAPARAPISLPGQMSPRPPVQPFVPGPICLKEIWKNPVQVSAYRPSPIACRGIYTRPRDRIHLNRTQTLGRVLPSPFPAQRGRFGGFSAPARSGYTGRNRAAIGRVLLQARRHRPFDLHPRADTRRAHHSQVSRRSRNQLSHHAKSYPMVAPRRGPVPAQNSFNLLRHHSTPGVLHRQPHPAQRPRPGVVDAID